MESAARAHRAHLRCSGRNRRALYLFPRAAHGSRETRSAPRATAQKPRKPREKNLKHDDFRPAARCAFGVTNAQRARARRTAAATTASTPREAANQAHSFASVLCCVPGTLAFFFDEVAAPRNRMLLRRSGGAG